MNDADGAIDGDFMNELEELWGVEDTFMTSV